MGALVPGPTRAIDFLTFPRPTNAVQLRLCTNASPEAAHLFNTIEIEAFGARLLASPGGDGLKQWLATQPTNISLHGLVVNGHGPGLFATNGMSVVEAASGPDWAYLGLDVTAAYRGQLKEYRRGLMFVAPDLLVIHDHVVATEPARFRLFLHPPAATRVDAVWGDLRLDLPQAGLRVHAPSRGMARSWERIESPADACFPGTSTMQLGPTNQLAQLDLISVFAVFPGGSKADYVFKLIESNDAVGARILRAGLPTVVAFKTNPEVKQASVTGFTFTGPAGVGVFQPRQKPAVTR